jgi:hypothetical protein
MVLIGFSDTLSLAQSVGIVGTMVLTLYFSKRHIQALSSDTETRVLNDLDEKFHRMIEIIMADPSMAKVISGIATHDYPKSYGVTAKEMAFSYYILWMCAHAFAMRQRKVLDDNEWTGFAMDEKLFSKRKNSGNMETSRTNRSVQSCLSD